MTDAPTISGALLLPRNRAGEEAAIRLRGTLAPLANSLGLAPTEIVRRIPDGPWRGAFAAPRALARGQLRAKDETTFPVMPPIAWRRGTTLRPYQTAALGAWHRAVSGVIIAPCGSGKTTMGIGAVQKTGTRTLVLVHTLDLVRQWETRLDEQLVGAKCGRAPTTPGAAPRERVVIATVQQLARWSWSKLHAWASAFGLVILDEAHHAPAATFSFVLSALPARFRLGLTATPDRADGMRQLMHAHLGEVAAEITTAQLERIGATLAPEIRYVPTNWSPAGDVPADEALAGADGRNRLIANLVRRQVADGRRVLVLVRRVEHAERLARAIGDKATKAAELVGSMRESDRHKRLTDFRYGKLQVLVATSLADEGLDLPEADTVVFASPSSNPGRVQQRVGRVLRPQKGKRAIVFDLIDSYESARKAARDRDQVYTAAGWRCEVSDRAGARLPGGMR